MLTETADCLGNELCVGSVIYIYIDIAHMMQTIQIMVV
jgi:hypothetical protein